MLQALIGAFFGVGRVTPPSPLSIDGFSLLRGYSVFDAFRAGFGLGSSVGVSVFQVFVDESVDLFYVASVQVDRFSALFLADESFLP